MISVSFYMNFGSFFIGSFSSVYRGNISDVILIWNGHQRFGIRCSGSGFFRVVVKKHGHDGVFFLELE